MKSSKFRYIPKSPTVYGVMKPLLPYLHDENVIELVINRQKEVGVLLRNRSWEWHTESDLDLRELADMAATMAHSNGKKMNQRDAPHAGIDLHMLDKKTGSDVMFRTQVVCGKRIVTSGFGMTIRKVDDKDWFTEDFVKRDNLSEIKQYFDLHYTSMEDRELDLQQYNLTTGFEAAYHAGAAFQAGKNIIIAAETGAGKTSFAKAMMKWLHPDERIITIEDSAELNLDDRLKNVVHLLYNAESAKVTGINANALFNICLRLNPTRIMVGEIRLDSAAAYINTLNSGHAGSLATIHANPAQAIDRVLQYAMSSPNNQINIEEARENLLKNVYGVFHLRVKSGSSDRLNHFHCLSKNPIDWRSAEPYVKKEEEQLEWAS